MKAAFVFDPQRMRSSLAWLAEMFPAEGKGSSGLEALFRMLEQLDLAGAGVWGERLSADELDQLCNQFPKAPSTRALLAIALILQHRRDSRAAQVLNLMVHRLPAKSELAFLQTRWAGDAWDELTAGALPWIHRYMGLAELPTPARFVMDCLREGSFKISDFERDTDHATPLLQGLIDFLFGEGVAYLAQLSEEKAGLEAERLLLRGEDPKVLNYINHFPNSRWRPAFLIQLHQRKGAPDPKRNRFYQTLDRGRIWGLRIQMYEAELGDAKLPVRKKIFWHDWLHYCHEVRFEETRTVFYLANLILAEEPDQTQIYLSSAPQKAWKTIVLDYKWEAQLREVLLNHQSDA